MLGEDIPVRCVYQQKIAFDNREAAILRDMPFTIDLNGQSIAWSDEDRDVLASDPGTRHLVEPMAGGIHCRPDGAVDGTWIKLGWAYNDRATDPHEDEPIDPASRTSYCGPPTGWIQNWQHTSADCPAEHTTMVAITR